MNVNTKKCVVCKQTGIVSVDPEEFAKYINGALIQDAMPSADDDTREQIISGTHPECRIKLFGKEE